MRVTSSPNTSNLAIRVTLKDLNSPTPVFVDAHATHVAGTIGAVGHSELAQGMAPASKIISFHWGADIAKLAKAGDMGITVTNHSYGAIGGWMVDTQSTCPVIWHWYGRDQDEESALYGSYGKDAAEFDRIAIANPKLSIFVAAGNEREWFGEPDKLPPDYFDGTHCVWKNGTWLTSKKKRAGNTRNGGYDTIAGAGLAKNVITVGAMRDLPTLWKRKDIAPTSFSSFGPADDGRIKPDVVANGDVIYSTAPPQRCDGAQLCGVTDIHPTELHGYADQSGTSMASPVASGIAALLNELALKTRHLGRTLLSHEMRAVLIHTALSPRDDDGPSYDLGWGSVQALPAGNLVAGRKGILERRTLRKGDTIVLELAWSEDVPARITVAWLDKYAAALSENAMPINSRAPILIDRIRHNVGFSGRRCFAPVVARSGKTSSPPDNRPTEFSRQHKPFRCVLLEKGKWHLEVEAGW